MILTPKQERALARMNPEAAARRRKTMELERSIMVSSKLEDDGVDTGGFRSALRAGLGK